MSYLLTKFLSIAILLLAVQAEARSKAVMEGIPASNTTILVDTTTARVTMLDVRISSLTATGDITANAFIGDGTGITGITATIGDGSITSAKLATDAVTSSKILNDAVTTGKIHPDARNTDASSKCFGTTNLLNGLDACVAPGSGGHGDGTDAGSGELCLGTDSGGNCKIGLTDSVAVSGSTNPLQSSALFTHTSNPNAHHTPGGGGFSVSQVVELTDDTTTSTTDVLLSGMTITPGAGDYVVLFQSSMDCTVASDMHVTLYVGGVAVAASEIHLEEDNQTPNTPTPISIMTFVQSVGVSDAIEVRWNTTSGTASMHNRTLIVDLR